ncbi:exonuclease subunit SbcC [Merismopedia glauca]|uniref:Nuclease SbcCD subunit C n=1 Tax=Merismopedia glauca CCAP 1448/3 TaxID=1296344 RepID=A0A2T1BYI6_9CYAN|nr:exonuclease subunit SbcC [Merismopedia glauca]PSB01090.1 ATP-binding cassette family protein [Merismopedia glauca CCAP 1448/3]
MIPLQLTLKNFLSYRQATVDFRGLHTACICGSNGAGKSSLLEAITWAIWGESRAATEDDVIQAGATEVRVDLVFKTQQETYRVIRSRQRGGGTALEFQVEAEAGLRSLTAKGVRATQQQIISCLKLDYDTFINSAYLRQGRADEFMLKRPNERKQILADLLKLDRYEQLAEQAKESAKEYKSQVEQIEQLLVSIQIQLQHKPSTLAEQAELQAQIAEISAAQATDEERLQQLSRLQHQRQNWQQQLVWNQQQHQTLKQECDRLEQDLAQTRQQQELIAAVIVEEAEINADYQRYLKLKAQEEQLNSKLELDRGLKSQKQDLQQELDVQIQQQQFKIREAELQLELLQQQEQENLETLSQQQEVATAVEQLQIHRQRLEILDKLQLEVAPLIQRRQSLQMELDRYQAKMTARLDELKATIARISAESAQKSRLATKLIEVNTKIEQVEKKRVYQERVRAKGIDKKAVREGLEKEQGAYEKLIVEIDQKLEMLKNPEACCPLCDRPLDAHYFSLVVEKTQTQQKQTQEQFWSIKEEIAKLEQELQGLRVEYSQISQELNTSDLLLQERGEITAQLQADRENQTLCQQLLAEQKQLETDINSGNFKAELQAELSQLETQLRKLNYDEKDHALVRGEAKRWLWAENRQSQIKEAQRRQANIEVKKPEFLALIVQAKTDIDELKNNSNLAKQILSIEQEILVVGYDLNIHNTVTKSLREAQDSQLKYQELNRAKAELPRLEQRDRDLAESRQSRINSQVTLLEQIEFIQQNLSEIPEIAPEIQDLERQKHQRNQQLQTYFSQLGRLEQQLIQLEKLETQLQENQEQIEIARREYRIYQELTQAFGKNGIQALMIENVLPQLEAETNHILSRLSGNQFHVQFITQKAGKSARSKSSKSAPKFIDTLEIVIADARGTRAYESYSGGEAFRINFAIRLALAKVLVQRSGSALQMLIIDEGFGTQDREGCERLIAAINAIASDFACILTVTHMPQFKEAFQTRIEVQKTVNGSQVSLLT